MKNKNGFTLIELIALLGILSIMILLITPNIINQIETNNNNKYNNFVSDLCLAAESYINHNKNITGLENFKNPNDTITINLGDLMNEGYIKSNTKNPNTNNAINETDNLIVTISSDMTYSCTLN